MKIMILGSGGREHAILKKLSENKNIKKFYVLPGNAGMQDLAECVDIRATDLEGVCSFAKEKKIDFAVVTPDDPLAIGMVDRLEAIGVPCFGPDQKAARIESSKIFSKTLMVKYGIPTASFRKFENESEAMTYVQNISCPTVIKADGLALGKGVYIAQNREEACRAVRELMEEKKFGNSGMKILVEEYLTGPEVSVLSFTDGSTLIPMISSMDHKRIGDGDTGPNTGGMGAIAPNPYYTKEIAQECMEKIFLPTIRAMKEEGCPFCGCLYFGLMLTKDGPRVIEYNCRFGDPETQAVLPLLKSDLFSIMEAVRNGNLAEVPVEFSEDHSCCVVMASGGYPGNYEKGKVIRFGSGKETVYHAGTGKTESGEIVTAGGRVLGVTAVRHTAEEARKASYDAVGEISFEGACYRHDIGTK